MLNDIEFKKRRMPMNSIVTLTDVNKTYHGTTKETRALQHCSLSIEKNAFTCIIGKSGSGKSTLLNAIGGLIQVDSGSVLVNQQELTKMNKKELARFRRENIGFVFQFFNLLQEQTVLENILLPFDLNNEKADLDFVNHVMKYLQIDDIKNKFPCELSGGQQQRVSIARAIVGKPNIILADEPTGNLDRENAKQVIQLLKECQSLFSQTIILVTHDIDLAKHADFIIYMEDGQVKSYE